MNRVGIDVGGTFTDLVGVLDGRIVTVKVPSTPRHPEQAALQAIEELYARLDPRAGHLEILAHGTTVATNALLEGRGARAALVTTRGFRDVLEIGRLSRPPSAIYNIQAEKPPALIPRDRRYEVTERLDYRGEVLVPLDEAEVARVAEALGRERVESVAVCYLFSHLNPAHEVRTREILSRLAPRLNVVLSSEIFPVFREYERSSTTAIAAALGPLVTAYLTEMERQLERWQLGRRFYIMQSNGGLTTPALAVETPTTLVLSGPAGGALAAAVIGEQTGFRNVISIDMGGTSFDVALIRDGRPFVTSDRRVQEYPLQTPMIDIETIGAGGGSVAWLDAADRLRVGPRSAGAEPGPACYGQGGQEPTVTDADLLLGYLNADYFLGGRKRLYPELAARVIDARLGELGLSIGAASQGIFRIVNTAMGGVIRVMCIGRGFDPREFALVAFGGAGPVHAAALARQLEIPTIIVPPHPGITSAMGLLMAEIVHDYIRTFLYELASVPLEVLDVRLAELIERAREALRSEGITDERICVVPTADLRYLGQTFTLEIPLGPPPFTDARIAEIRRAFHARHADAYGFKVEDEPVEIVNLRVRGIGTLEAYRPRVLETGSAPVAESKGTRAVWFEGQPQPVEARLYDRTTLGGGARLAGPAIVEQVDSTTVIPPGMVCRVDSFGNLILTTER